MLDSYNLQDLDLIERENKVRRVVDAMIDGDDLDFGVLVDGHNAMGLGSLTPASEVIDALLAEVRRLRAAAAAHRCVSTGPASYQEAGD